MRLKELRLDNNLSQDQIAKIIKTSQRSISRWESGIYEPTASALIALADFFKVSVDYLLNREDEFGNIVIQGEERSYTREENKIIDDYRKLPPHLQSLIKETIKTFKEKQT